MKKILVLSLSVLLSIPMFSQSSMQDRASNWTKETPKTSDGIIGDNPGPTGPTVPAGETTWALILGLGAAYGAFALTRKRKAENN